MSNEFTPPVPTPDKIEKMESMHVRFGEAVDAGHALPSDGRLGRPVSESLTPEAAAYVLGATDKIEEAPTAEAQ